MPFAIAASRGATRRARRRARLGLRALPALGAEVDARRDRRLPASSRSPTSAIFGEPEQEDIAEDFGPVPVQILLIAIAAPISEEVCFRGMLFGGLRERLPRLAAALISGLIFGALHATDRASARCRR